MKLGQYGNRVEEWENHTRLAYLFKAILVAAAIGFPYLILRSYTDIRFDGLVELILGFAVVAAFLS